MASPERKISAVWSAGPDQSSGVDARLAGLEDEAVRLRAEIAALQDDIRWLTGDDDEPAAEAGWLARGWVRASLLLASVGVVAIVSLPYLLHSDPLGPERAPAVTARPAPAAQPVSVPTAAVKTVAQEAIPTPARVRETEVPAPARALSAEDRPIPAPRLRVARERRTETPDTVAVTTPLPRENSP